jgi:hypothetical protein
MQSSFFFWAGGVGKIPQVLCSYWYFKNIMDQKVALASLMRNLLAQGSGRAAWKLGGRRASSDLCLVMCPCTSPFPSLASYL